ncbi:hypothetical protein AMELA_G00142070 [Ameiurus melas]|uniref:Uncharacterized protein n=1 Tax=Ameiurus melas TaxID=219545 RepID=A0A7J6AKM1_AMEME|nr:hypothetical protein AMELA_G00142070 [Ameiurus melas]
MVSKSPPCQDDDVDKSKESDLWCLRRGLLHHVMAKFHGPRFLFLVLAGVVLCKQGHTETTSNSSTQSSTPTVKSSIPAVKSSTPTVTTTVSQPSTQGTANGTSGQEISSTSTSDSPRISSTKNTTSPPPTPSTTTDKKDTNTSALNSSVSNIPTAGAGHDLFFYIGLCEVVIASP